MNNFFFLPINLFIKLNVLIDFEKFLLFLISSFNDSIIFLKLIKFKPFIKDILLNRIYKNEYKKKKKKSLIKKKAFYIFMKHYM